MAYYGGGGAYGGYTGGVPGGQSGGFPGGYNQIPGNVPNANVGHSGAVYTMGTHSPSVDPSNFSGTVHFGQANSYGAQGYGQFAPGAGMVDPNLAASGAFNLNPGAANLYPGAANLYPGAANMYPGI